MFDAFPQVVHAELERIGQNQRWLAKQLKISHVSVSNWLSNKRRPTMQNIEAVARAFGRNASWLFEQMEHAGVATDVPTSTPAPVDPNDGPHPLTGEVTRELDAAAIDRMLALEPDEACPTCGRHGEAA